MAQPVPSRWVQRTEAGPEGHWQGPWLGAKPERGQGLPVSASAGSGPPSAGGGAWLSAAQPQPIRPVSYGGCSSVCNMEPVGRRLSFQFVSDSPFLGQLPARKPCLPRGLEAHWRSWGPPLYLLPRPPEAPPFQVQCRLVGALPHSLDGLPSPLSRASPSTLCFAPPHRLRRWRGEQCPVHPARVQRRGRGWHRGSWRTTSTLALRFSRKPAPSG